MAPIEVLIDCTSRRARKYKNLLYRKLVSLIFRAFNRNNVCGVGTNTCSYLYML